MKGLNGDTTQDGVRVLCYGAAALVLGIAWRLAIGPEPTGLLADDPHAIPRGLSGLLIFGGVCCVAFGLFTMGRARR